MEIRYYLGIDWNPEMLRMLPDFLAAAGASVRPRTASKPDAEALRLIGKDDVDATYVMCAHVLDLIGDDDARQFGHWVFQVADVCGPVTVILVGPERGGLARLDQFVSGIGDGIAIPQILEIPVEVRLGKPRTIRKPIAKLHYSSVTS